MRLTSRQNDFLLARKDSACLKPLLICFWIVGWDVSTNTANFTRRNRSGRKPPAATPPGLNVGSFHALEF